MSLRRKSCDACFKGRRKCDRDHPACGTCRRTKKSCHYIYAPVSSTSLPDGPVAGNTATAQGFAAHTATSAPNLEVEQSESTCAQGWPVSDAVRALRAICSESASLQANPAVLSTSSASLIRPPTLPKSNIPNFLGCLGEVQRVEGSTDSWRWVIGELKRCPRDLATRGETLFLHKDLYSDGMPRAIRAALGISAAFCMLDEDKRQILFRALDAEVLELIRMDPGQNQDYGFGGVTGTSDIGGNSSGLTLLDELARLQAFTLYQMMRIYDGSGLEQRLVAEQQRDLLTTWALQLLRRSMAELGSDGHRSSSEESHMASWHTWIVAESIRRTVMVVYMFYGVYSMAINGYCVELPTLAKLPVSKAPAQWHSEATYMARRSNGEAPQTWTYEDFTDSWMKSPPGRVDPFDKFLIVPCKGLEVVSF